MRSVRPPKRRFAIVSRSIVVAALLTFAAVPVSAQQVGLAWDAPANPGASAITGYRVQVATTIGGVYADAAGCPTNSTTTSCTATGLTTGTQYFFRVAAINDAGPGPYSDSIGVTPGVVPNTPTAVTGVSGNQQVSVSWTPSADLVSPPLTGYQVQVATSVGGVYANATGCATSSTTPSCIATGLTNGTQYFFKVAGINALGTGAYSTASSGVTAGTVPGAPTSVAATSGNTTATVTFVAPASNGGAITSYTAVSNPGNVSAAGASSPLVVTGLTNGTAYTFTVRATNPVGTGPASAASNSVTPLPTVFTDNPIAAGGMIKRIHILELRGAINAARLANSLAAFVFTDDSLVAGSTPIKSVHITQLRTALQAVYVQRGMTPPVYTDPTLSTSTTIKAVHINQLRSAVLAVQ